MSAIYLTLSNPREAARVIPLEQPMVAGAAVALLGPFSEALGGILLVRSATGAGSGLPYLLWSSWLGFWGLVLALLVGGIFLPVGARLIGGEGSAERLLWALLFSFSPVLLWTPLALVGHLTGHTALFYGFTTLFLLLWVIWIQICVLSELFRLGLLRGLFAVAMGYGLAAILFLGVVFFDVLRFFDTLVLWTT